MHNKLLGGRIPRGSRLHFHRVVAISQFRQGKTADGGEVVDAG